MGDEDKTKEQLIYELAEAHRRISELEESGAEHKRAEEALLESEKRFRTIAETAGEAIIIFDTQENIFFWNQAARDIFGYWGGETRGKLLASILSKPFQEVLRRGMEQVISTGESDLIGKAVEATGVRKDGSGFPLELSLATWRTKQEAFFTIIARDITERKQAEEALWESEKRFRTIAETAGEAIIIFDTQENIFFWNQAARNIFGYMVGETRGKLLASILSKPFQEVLRRGMEQVISTGESDLIGKAVEATGVRKDGSGFPLELSLAAWRTKQEALFFTIIARDITERKQAEEAIQKAYTEVEKRVEERTAELKRETAKRERLQQEVIEAQERAIQELSTPLVPISEKVLILPLVGTIDSQRARRIMEVLLEGVISRRARVVIVDITGIPLVDTSVANHLLQATRALRLVGAECILVGITPEVAQTVVGLGVELRELVTRNDLQGGVEYAQYLLGQRIL